jgi:hypothetical protein
MTDPGELSEPVQDGSGSATRDDKIAGLLQQVAADVALRPGEDAVGLLTLRLADAGIEMDDHEIAELAANLPAFGR